MGWFSWLPWNKRRDLEKLEAEARKNMSPATLSILAEKYYQSGEYNNAVECVRRAIERFPDSPKVKEVHAQIMRLHNQQTLAKLQKEIETRPKAETYARLADLFYRDMNDLNRALELANEGLEKFPDNEDLHLLTGLIRFVRYQADRLSQDGLKCIEHLEAASRANPMNYKACAMLARMFTEVGAFDRTTVQLNNILRFAPDDEKARRLLDKLRGMEPLGTDLEDLFKSVQLGGPNQDCRDLANVFPVEYNKGQAAPARLDSQLAASHVADFKRVEGAKAALVMDESGTVIGSFASSGSSAELAEMIWNIFTGSEDSARRMDIGSFKRGILEAPGMRLHMVEAGGHLIAVVTSKTTRDEIVRSALNAYIDTVLKA
ncbi:MAG: hypothetical protein FD180_4218 [Planctomycetota bacterium]|nr:MAG: hypothetical protein FD180_4218 [Planctomycetota bacterium]